MTVRVCNSCGATPAEATFARKVKGQPLRCADCIAAPVDATPPPPGPHKMITRARYRAGVRRRAAHGQLDWVDQMRPPP